MSESTRKQMVEGSVMRRSFLVMMQESEPAVESQLKKKERKKGRKEITIAQTLSWTMLNFVGHTPLHTTTVAAIEP